MTLSPPASVFATGKQTTRGRKGSRAQLATKFFADTYALWEEQGPAVLARAAFHDPMAFASMVARLMPQKIEVTTPTDGMSDERLAELLDYAERMAALKAGQTIEGVAFEKPLSLNALEGPGGGPLGGLPPGGVKTAHTIDRDAGESDHPEEVNKVSPTPAGSSVNDCSELRPQSGCYPAALPNPVGRPQPLSAVELSRLNRAKLIEVDDIDPQSLF